LGKPDLVVAVIERQVEQVLDAQQPQLGEIDSFPSLHAWLDLSVQLHATADDALRCPLGALAAELAEADPDARASLGAGFDQWTTLIAEGLSRMQAAGELDPAADARRLARSALASYHGGLLLAQIEGSVAPLRAAMDGAAAALGAHRR
jgi:TetR/AcrR family transcriptional repressor of nem operon